MSENILTIREVADLLKINEKTVYKLAADNKIVNRRAKLTPDRRPILTPFVGHKRGAPDRVKLVGVAQPGRARMIGLFGFSFESGS